MVSCRSRAPTSARVSWPKAGSVAAMGFLPCTPGPAQAVSRVLIRASPRRSQHACPLGGRSPAVNTLLHTCSACMQWLVSALLEALKKQRPPRARLTFVNAACMMPIELQSARSTPQPPSVSRQRGPETCPDQSAAPQPGGGEPELEPGAAKVPFKGGECSEAWNVPPCAGWGRPPQQASLQPQSW